MKKYNFLAFDIGATSGRAVLGTLVGDKFEMQELHDTGPAARLPRYLYGRCAGRIFPACSPVGSLPAYRYTDHEF